MYIYVSMYLYIYIYIYIYGAHKGRRADASHASQECRNSPTYMYVYMHVCMHMLHVKN